MKKLKTGLTLPALILLVALAGLASSPEAARHDEMFESSSGAQDRAPHKKSKLTFEDRRAWREILKWPQDCEDDFGDHGADYAGVEFYKLAEGKYLVEVECEIAAYQSVKYYMLYNENVSPATSKLLTFKTYGGENERSMVETQTDSLLGVSTFDQRQKRLTIFYKLRGFGDCGTIATYNLRGGKPVLTDFRAKLNCDGRGSKNPFRWKKIGPPVAKRQRR